MKLKNKIRRQIRRGRGEAVQRKYLYFQPYTSKFSVLFSLPFGGEGKVGREGEGEREKNEK